MTSTDMQQPNYEESGYRKYPVEMQKLTLTPEESRLWQECLKNTSALFPAIGFAAIGYTSFALTRFRSYAKHSAFLSGLTSLVLCKVSIAYSCLAKVASMPNSNLAERIKEARNLESSRLHELQFSKEATFARSEQAPSAEIEFDDYPPMNSYDTYSSLNDSSDVPAAEDIDLIEPINTQIGVTYDELRHKNREEYYKKLYPKQEYPKTSERYSTRETPTQASPVTSQGQNKYGDTWG